MSEVLVVGSLAFDSIKTPHGEVEDEPGGAATYFSLAASEFAPVNLVGVVGDDFDSQLLGKMEERNVDLEGLQIKEGKETFRWKGHYETDLEARTDDTQLNVFAEFDPTLPDEYRNTPYVFLGNIDPEIQLSVLEQINSPRIVACDTMNFWIEGKPDALGEVLEQVDFFFLNDSEARLMTGEDNLIHAARDLLSRGPSVVIIKKGEHGVFMVGRDWQFILPGFPVGLVKDPTGAGDSFGGGFMGYMAQNEENDFQALKESLVHGNIIASFTVEHFGLQGLLELEDWDLDERYQRFVRLTHFDF
ncbi:MAG: PfkB family carbohydrate kinase [bacterium]